ncbi:DUF5724 domain-containing protein [Pannus brasiliensis CCIBt3594]|uniref:DUF5724 domain-containing protein n=1 Tax=Pannus brasiliensis CCIBt3594 TaxID=1427578 RepID=A0AAW9QUR5_9CHRO
MLTHEQAQARLQPLRDPDRQTDRLAKVADLPGSLQPIARGLLGRDETGNPLDFSRAYQTLLEMAGKLNHLGESDRLQIFRLLFPTFADTVERAWQLFPRLPYQEYSDRRGFRAPHHSEKVHDKRSNWLQRLIAEYQYEQDLTWYAAWCPYLSYYAGETLGILFAAAIDEKDALGEEIFAILVASARGEHEIGAMGRHVTRGLLVANRPEGWECIENLLLAAQRQEGLRQVILETIDEAHSEAFHRILRLIVEKDLTRFSATVRAVDVWFGLRWESVNNRVVKKALETVLGLFDRAGDLKEVLADDDPETVYFALWVMGFRDVMEAIEPARELLHSDRSTHRFVAVYFLSQVGLVESRRALIPAIEDGDSRVATRALISLQQTDPAIHQTDLFERLERVLPRFPEQPKSLTPIVWNWLSIESSRQLVTTALVNNLGERSPKRLIPYIPLLTVYERRDVAKKLAAVYPWDEEIRNALFSLVGDASSWVREEAIRCFEKRELTDAEAIALEKLLTRKSADLRRGILQLLLNRSDTETLASAKRLLDSKQALQRQAGLELLKELKSGNRSVQTCTDYAREYQEKKTKLTETENKLLETLLEIDRKEATLEDALGLADLTRLGIAIEPTVRAEYLYVTPAVSGCLQSLDDLIHEHRHTPIISERYGKSHEELLGNCNGFFYPNSSLSREENIASIPLRELWEKWERERGEEYRDEDGLELIRSLASIYTNRPRIWQNPYLETYQNTDWWKKLRSTLFVDTSELRYPYLIRSILTALLYLHSPDNTVPFLLEASAITLTGIPFLELADSGNGIYMASELKIHLCGWIEVANFHRSQHDWTGEQKLRYWQFTRYTETFNYFDPFYDPNKLETLGMIYRLGGVAEDDIIYYLLGSRSNSNTKRSFHELGTLTARKVPANLDPILKEIGDRCRQRVLEVELQRGDLPTAASEAALGLRSIEGISTLVRLLQMLGKDKFIRGYTYHNLSKPAVFSHLIRVSYPAPSETPQDFAKAVETAEIPRQTLIELAFYAPQWSRYVEHVLNWENSTEAIWWIHAHTKDNQWHVDSEIRQDWAVQVSERTPLSEQDLIDGAVDVDWFFRIYPSLAGEPWRQLHEAAKYASSGGGHNRARLFAEAMLGEIEKETLVKRITEKRNQDAVRALGLLPLRDDLLERYQVIQEFIRTSRQFGSQRQASEKLAARVGMENLSRTAGYPDPQRLEWAMEGAAIADLVEKPFIVTIGEVSVSLSITPLGKPEITVTKNGKSLKSIPANLKKDPDIVHLQSRKQDIARQETRTRLSLEQAMCRGDKFTVAELRQLLGHPVLAPMLRELIFIGESDIGYPVGSGQALRHHDGTVREITSETLKIAHASDLLQTGEWQFWQGDCFAREVTQPFKQVFRELYLLTQTEIKNDVYSRRYEGHQLNPKQAIALWGQRGWVACSEEGVRRTFHDANLSVWVTFLDGFYTPLEMEGLTLEGVYFTRRGEGKPLPLTEIPPAIFSEVMRDIDLVVSVVHLGGVDPEASASTVELRGALIRESCRLLKLENVRVQDSRALIEGKLGSYSIHLGSGVVHRQPGGALCIIPVHSQHRGRLFLPFADDDPKTAEVLSKVVLLAKDKDIKDPSILEQIL